MTFIGSVRQKSRHNLKGSFRLAISVSIIAVAFEMLLTAFEGLILALCDYFNITAHIPFLDPQIILELVVALSCGIIWLFVISPLIIGEKRWYGNLILNRKLSVKEVFYFFTSPNRYFKAVWLSFMIFIQRFFYAIALSVIPICAFALSDVLFENNSQVTQNFGVVSFLLGCGFLAIGLILFVKVFLGFSLATHVFAMDERVNASRAIKVSKKCVNKNEGKIILFELSFLYVYILEFLIIPLFFILPHYNCAHATLSHELLEKHPEITNSTFVA